jgi:hypothetical protein
MTFREAYSKKKQLDHKIAQLDFTNPDVRRLDAAFKSLYDTSKTAVERMDELVTSNPDANIKEIVDALSYEMNMIAQEAGLVNYYNKTKRSLYQ